MNKKIKDANYGGEVSFIRGDTSYLTGYGSADIGGVRDIRADLIDVFEDVSDKTGVINYIRGKASNIMKILKKKED